MEHSDQRWNRRSYPGTDVQPRLRLPKHQRVSVRINEARHQRPAAQVPLLAIMSRSSSTVFEGAGPDDAVTQDSDGLDPQRIRHGQDWTAAEHDGSRLQSSYRQWTASRNLRVRSSLGLSKNSAGGASSMISPPSIMMTRSAARLAKPTSCVTT